MQPDEPDKAQLPDSSSLRYRRRAEELRGMATEAPNATVQNELLMIAQKYEKLAKELGALIERWS